MQAMQGGGRSVGAGSLGFSPLPVAKRGRNQPPRLPGLRGSPGMWEFQDSLRPVRPLQDCGHLVLSFVTCRTEKGETRLPGLRGEGGESRRGLCSPPPHPNSTILH